MEYAFLDRHVGMEIDGGGLERFVTQPEGDDDGVDAGGQQVHRGREVAGSVDRHPYGRFIAELVARPGVAAGVCTDVFGRAKAQLHRPIRPRTWPPPLRAQRSRTYRDRLDRAGWRKPRHTVLAAPLRPAVASCGSLCREGDVVRVGGRFLARPCRHHRFEPSSVVLGSERRDLPHISSRAREGSDRRR